MRCLVAISLAALCPLAVQAQILSVPLSQTVRGSVAIIDNIPDDVGILGPDGAFYKRVYTVPAGRTFRMTDFGANTRRADTSQNPCFVELWKGTDTAVTAMLWKGIKIFATDEYDRSWVSGPPIDAGQSLWVKFYTGVTPTSPSSTFLACTRANSAENVSVRFAIRGFIWE